MLLHTKIEYYSQRCDMVNKIMTGTIMLHLLKKNSKRTSVYRPLYVNLYPLLRKEEIAVDISSHKSFVMQRKVRIR